MEKHFADPSRVVVDEHAVTLNPMMTQKNNDSPIRRHYAKETRALNLVLHQRIWSIRSRRTIVAALLPHRLATLFYSYIYSAWVSVLIVPLWAFCTIVNFTIFAGFPIVPIHIFAPLQIILTTYIVSFQMAFLNIDIFKHLCRCFNFWYILYHILSFNLCLAAIWDWDFGVVIGCLHSATSELHFVAFDAYPSRTKKKLSKYVFLGIVSLLPVLVLVFLSLSPRYQMDHILVYHNIEILNIRSQASDSLCILILYFIRILYVRYKSKDQDCLIFLSSFYEMDRLQTKRNQIANISSAADSKSERELGEKACESQSLEEHEAKKADKAECKSKTMVRIPQDGSVVQMEAIDATKSRICGILQTKRIELHSRDTLFHMFIDNKHKMIASIIRHRLYFVFVLGGSVLNIFLQMTISLGVIHSEPWNHLSILFSTFSAFTITLQLVLTTNRKIVRYTFMTFDYWYVTALLGQVVLCYGLLTDWDYRTFGVFSLALMCQAFLFMDAMADKVRSAAWISFLAILWTIIAGTAAKFGLASLYTGGQKISVFNRDLLYARSNLTSALFSIAIFFSRFIWSLYRNRSRILFVTGNWQTSSVQDFTSTH